MAYLCLDCFLILSINSSDHTGVVIGNVFTLNGSEEIPSIMSLIYAVNFGSEIRSLTLVSHLNCPLSKSASSFPTVNAMVVPTLPKIASMTSGNICEIY